MSLVKFENSEAVLNLLFKFRLMLLSNTKSGSKLSERLEILQGLEPGEVKSTVWVGVKSFNPYWTTCGETFQKSFIKTESFHIRRLTRTGSTVRDESVGSDRD